MKEIFRAETISQFVLTGNINDFVLVEKGNEVQFFSLKQYLTEVMFMPFDVVLLYDRGKGIEVAKGADHFYKYLRIVDKYHGTHYASDLGLTVGKDTEKILEVPGMLPGEPKQALELIDRFINAVSRFGRQNNTAALPGANTVSGAIVPRSVAVIIDYANFLAPRGESIYMSGELGAGLIKIIDWAENPAITGANIATVLLSENLMDLSTFITDSPYSAKLQIKLPDKEEITVFLNQLVLAEKEFNSLCPVEIPILAGKLVGLSRVNIKGLLLRALRNRKPITMDYLTRLKKEVIEKEASGRLEFIESHRTLDDVAGHDEAKKWLREDTLLIKKGVTNALPMGYLLAGRIGTGKTFLVQCFAGECGIPFVELKNFRERWVGATEGNLEKIFAILQALGQVVVFVDEADQATGKRSGDSGDSGLSGRVYAMLAQEMSRTENRGKIFWMFATSRPDLLEVDLKRQGRLDVHIPLFPPEDEKGISELFMAMARKLKIKINPEDMPALNFKDAVSGNELEGLLVRTVRRYELQPEGEGEKKNLAEVLKEVVAGFRPSRHTARLELMDLLAVKECTDDRFLPARFQSMSAADIDNRIALLGG
ncbi:MAG: ATP-binding protein [Acidobacteria bacterium]|nr:ATP-binding protein [Acidobacteriota bacterium]